MLYSQEQINTIINNVITTNGLDSAKVNGVPLGVIGDNVDLKNYGDKLLSQPSIANPFVNGLYQQFIYKATRENIFSSPFDYFREKRDGVAFGTYETDVQPIMPLEFDMYAFDRVLKFWETPVITQYFAITRMDTFPQTITKQILRQAFVSYEAFDNFLAKLILASRQGNTIIETNAVKTVLNRNLASGVIKRRGFNKPETEDEWRALASEIVGVAIGMTAEPTTEYNNYVNIDGSNGLEAWAQSDKRDLVLMGDSDTIAHLRTFVLAMSFNKEDVDFNFHFITVNNWDYCTYDYETRTLIDKQTSPLKLILCDGGYIKFEDNLDDEFSDANIMTMGLQRALQVQQTIGLRVNRNAVAWVELAEGETVDIYKFTDVNSVKYLLTNDETGDVAVSVNKLPVGLSASTTVSYRVKNATCGLIGDNENAIELTEAEVQDEIFFIGLNEDLTGIIVGRSENNLEKEGVTENMYITATIYDFAINPSPTSDTYKYDGEITIVTPAVFSTEGGE